MSQHMDALAQANVVRFEIARVKGEIAALSRTDGALRVAALLRDPDDAAGAVRLDDLIASIRRVGPRQTVRLLRGCAISATARRYRVRELSARQRGLLADTVARLAVPLRPTSTRGTLAAQRERHARVLKMVEEGLSYAEIAQRLGYALPSSVRRVAARRTA